MEELRREVLRVLPDIRRFAISLAGNKADGDDLLQVTVERVLRKGVPDDVELKRWMFRVAKNKVMSRLSRARKMLADALETDVPDNVVPLKKTKL